MATRGKSGGAARAGDPPARAARPGDHIVVESEKVGRPAREGEILAIHESPLGTSYDVRWNDGHESSFRPAAGSVRVIRVG
jgi:hypothetical protein